MIRDFIGYANSPPKVSWPNSAKLAISFVLNYEEGAEKNILDGDDSAENLFTDIPDIQVKPGKRHYSSESMFEYGSRTGVWRLINLFDSYQIPLTFFATGLALERNSVLCDYIKASNHEIAGHGYRWINYINVPLAIEEKHIQKTIDIIQGITGKNCHGWYTGRCSENTRKLLKAFDITYDSQAYNDDLPYWIDNHGKPLLIIPYTLDINDIRYLTMPGWTTPCDAFQTMKYAFDTLYDESQYTPKMLTIGLHARISGRPARYAALKQFIDYIYYKDIVCCTRYDIAKTWIAQFPYQGG